MITIKEKKTTIADGNQVRTVTVHKNVPTWDRNIKWMAELNVLTAFDPNTIYITWDNGVSSQLRNRLKKKTIGNKLIPHIGTKSPFKIKHKKWQNNGKNTQKKNPGPKSTSRI